MIVDCVADCHGYKPILEGGDLLIIAGDCTARNAAHQWLEFFIWLDDQKYEKIVLIAGNHDGYLQRMTSLSEILADSNISYLQDSSTTFRGYKIYGSPWTPTFKKWHFMKDRGPEIAERWALIPEDTDILVTHGPPAGVLDLVERFDRMEHIGCKDLFSRVINLKLTLHVFGHIHGSYGQMTHPPLRYVNCSLVNEQYEHVNKPIRVELPNKD